jgi:ABC-2 type transport system permease protein
VNPLSSEVDALRGLLLGIPFDIALDLGVLIAAAAAGIVAAWALPDRLAQ